MQEDFHYYATYCAAYIAGYSHEESQAICYSAQLVDLCSATFLEKLHAPIAAATTQLQMEMMNTRADRIGLQDITRIWSSFHFLPFDLYAKTKAGKKYLRKYRLICNTNGDLVVDTVDLAKNKSLQAVGIAMHVLADTWAHRYFAGTPSQVINNTNDHFYELIKDGETETERKIDFRHNPGAPDDPEKGIYINTPYQPVENAIMNLGHGRAGHLPDYSYIRYKYLPAWGGYEEVIKDNPSDYYHAFCQMIYALKYLRGAGEKFEKETYDFDAAAPYEEEIKAILTKRQLLACDDWKALGERLSGCVIDDFDLDKYSEEYTQAPAEHKENSFLGKFIIAAMSQKSMVTNKIYNSGNMLAGYSVDYSKKGFRGIKDYKELVKVFKGGRKHE